MQFRARKTVSRYDGKAFFSERIHCGLCLKKVTNFFFIVADWPEKLISYNTLNAPLITLPVADWPEKLISYNNLNWITTKFFVADWPEKLISYNRTRKLRTFLLVADWPEKLISYNKFFINRLVRTSCRLTGKINQL